MNIISVLFSFKNIFDIVNTVSCYLSRFNELLESYEIIKKGLILKQNVFKS